MNGKPGVLAVMDAEIACLPIMAEMMTGHDGDAFDAEEAVRRMTEARATVERLLSAAEGAEAFIGVMFGSVNGRLPETVDTPLGIPVKLGAIARNLSAALAAFRGEQS